MAAASIPAPIRARHARVQALARAGRGDHAEAAMVIPRANYIDPAIAAAELASTFSAVLMAGPSSLVREAGAYHATTLVDTPVVLTRDQDGRAHVLLNVCRHRGAGVVSGAGCSRRLTCPYHGWAYDETGALVGLPGKDGFADQDMDRLGLVELPSEERHGFIWTMRDPDGVLDLDAHLGAFDAELASWGITYDVAASMDITVASNWKCSLEAFQETYHFPYVHKDSIVGQGTMSNVVAFDQFGRHHSLGVPLKGIADAPDDVDEAGEQLSIIYYLYPCTVMACSPIGAELLQFYPGATPSESHVRHTVLSRMSVDDAEVRAFWDAYVPVIQNVVIDEDGVVLESCGKGLAAGHVDVVVGANEIGVQAAHRQIQADLAAHAR